MELKKHEELLKELQTKYPTAILDGAVNSEEWAKLTKNRILWILKEVNDYPGDLRELLNNPDTLCEYKRWKATYGLVAKVSYGLLTGEWVEDADKLVKDEKVLQKIAVINVNKLSGKNRANSKEMAQAAEKFHDVVFKQIELLDPNLVILGGTGDLLSKWLPKGYTERKWILVDHPGQTKIPHERYYKQIVSLIATGK